MAFDFPAWAEWMGFVASVLGALGSVLVAAWALKLSYRLTRMEESRDRCRFRISHASPKVLGASFAMTVINLGGQSSSIESIRLHALGANGEHLAASLYVRPISDGPWTVQRSLAPGEVAELEVLVSGAGLDLENPGLYPLGMSFRLKPVLGDETTYEVQVFGPPTKYDGPVSRFV